MNRRHLSRELPEETFCSQPQQGAEDQKENRNENDRWDQLKTTCEFTEATSQQGTAEHRSNEKSFGSCS